MSALPGWWRWMDGMRVIDDFGASYRVTIAGDAYEDSEGTATWINVTDGGDYGPDPTDPATIGCLLARVREMWGDPSAHTRFSRSRGVWEVSVHHELCRDLCGPTEYAALLAAGDAAWARRGGGA